MRELKDERKKVFALFESNIANKETNTKYIVKQLHKFLSPAFDIEINSPEEKFKIQDSPSAIKIIRDIFYSFYGESKTTDALSKMITRP